MPERRDGGDRAEQHVVVLHVGEDPGAQRVARDLGGEQLVDREPRGPPRPLDELDEQRVHLVLVADDRGLEEDADGASEELPPEVPRLAEPGGPPFDDGVAGGGEGGRGLADGGADVGMDGGAPVEVVEGDRRDTVTGSDPTGSDPFGSDPFLRQRQSSGTGCAFGSPMSGPAITLRSSSRSSIVRAIGPMTPVSENGPPHGGKCPVAGTRPGVGLSPQMPLKWAGTRIDPPPSLPTPPAESPAAIAAASPPLDPPGVRSRSQGLLVRPYTALSVSHAISCSATFVTPRMIAPAAFARLTMGASTLADDPGAGAGPDVPRHAFDLDRALHAERDAVERPQPVASLHGGLGLAGSRARARLVDGDERVQSGIERVDPGEVGVDELDGGDLPPPYESSHLGRRQRGGSHYGHPLQSTTRSRSEAVWTDASRRTRR